MNETERKVLSSIAELVRSADEHQKEKIEVWCDGLKTGMTLATAAERKKEA